MQVADLSLLDYGADQAHLFMRTAVLAGIHGAGMANQFWLRPHRGVVVEVLHQSAGQHHYDSLASMLGHKYIGVPKFIAHDITAAVVQAMDYAAATWSDTLGRP